MRRLALVVGDTAGHFFPALAVAQAYQRRISDVEIVFFGPASVGAELARRNGCRYRPVSSGQLARVRGIARSSSAFRTVAAVLEAQRALRELHTQMVVGFGGHDSGAVVLAGKMLGVATAINEGNVQAGIANRLLARFVNRVYVSRSAMGLLPAGRLCVTGWPIRAEIAALSAAKRNGRYDRRLRMLVCSGSRGGAFFSLHMPALVRQLAARGFTVQIWHQCADVAEERVLDAYQQAGVEARVMPFIDDMAAAYRWADFAIARGGAGTIAELAAAAIPSMIVPLSDAAQDHQSCNAREFASSGAALWSSEGRWDSTAAAEQIANVAGDSSAWASMSANALRCAFPRAADAVVDECERILNGGR